jgi:translation initiation factor 4A
LDFRDSSEKEQEKEVINASQSILLEEPTCIIEESGLYGKSKENKISTPAATVNKETTVESSEPEGVQSLCQNSTRMIGEDRFKGEQA